MDLDHSSGAPIKGWPEVVQSLATILTTRLETRVFRRDFGSDLPALIDAPMNDSGVLAVYVAVAKAIEAWEPRFELTGIDIATAENGQLRLKLSGNYLPRAHVGDFTLATDSSRAVRVESDSANSWSLVA